MKPGLSWIVVFATTLIALVLTVVPVPAAVAIVRPTFVLLTIIYWSIMSPRTGGQFLAIISGLAEDVLSGSLLGEHALAMVLIAYLAIRLHLMLRAKPLFEQALYVFAALLVYETVLWIIDGFSGHPVFGAARWAHPLTGALMWPIVVGILGRFRSER